MLIAFNFISHQRLFTPELKALEVLANFSALSTTPPIKIRATELRGISIDQLAVLLDFVKERAASWCEAHKDHPNYGNPLDFETFNLYHASFWVINPATRDHGGTGCSYVELVAISKNDQRPKWFVSHAWLEPVLRFMLCLKHHALLRQLSPQSAYWVCALENLEVCDFFLVRFVKK